MNSQAEFYVGYLPIPAGVKRFARRVVITLAATVVATALVLVFAQSPFAASVFEFGARHDFDGVLITKPYPALVVPGGLPWLLVGPGKHGFDAPAALDGRVVRLRGERILRGPDRMIEVDPSSLTSRGAGQLPAEADLG